MISCVSPSVIWSDCATGSCPMAMQQLPKQTKAVKTVSIIFFIIFSLGTGYEDRLRFVCRGESLNFSLGFRRTSPYKQAATEDKSLRHPRYAATQKQTTRDTRVEPPTQYPK